MYVVVLGNQKGGSTKTTSTANFAAIAGEAGLRVLTVDLDPQGQLTESFGVEARQDASVGELLDSSLATQPSFSEVVLAGVFTNVDLLPAEERPLERVERDMDSDPLTGLTRLRELLATVADDYDLVLIDTPPRLTSLTVGPLVAADAAVVTMTPTTFHFMSAQAFVAKVEQVRNQGHLNPDLRLLGALFTRYKPDLEESKVVEQLVVEEGWHIFDARVPDSALASKVVLQGLPPAAVTYPYLPFAHAYQGAFAEMLERLDQDAVQAEAI